MSLTVVEVKNVNEVEAVLDDVRMLKQATICDRVVEVINNLVVENEELAAKLAATTAGVEGLVDSNEAALKGAKGRIAELESDLEAIQEELNDVTEVKEHTAEVLGHKIELLADSEAKRKELGDRIQALESLVEVMQSDIALKDEMIGNKDKIIADLTGKVEDKQLVTRNKELADENSELKKKIGMLEAALTQLASEQLDDCEADFEPDGEVEPGPEVDKIQMLMEDNEKLKKENAIWEEEFDKEHQLCEIIKNDAEWKGSERLKWKEQCEIYEKENRKLKRIVRSRKAKQRELRKCK